MSNPDQIECATVSQVGDGDFTGVVYINPATDILSWLLYTGAEGTDRPKYVPKGSITVTQGSGSTKKDINFAAKRFVFAVNKQYIRLYYVAKKDATLKELCLDAVNGTFVNAPWRTGLFDNKVAVEVDPHGPLSAVITPNNVFKVYYKRLHDPNNSLYVSWWTGPESGVNTGSWNTRVALEKWPQA